nr:GNAT family N-acetyltransferase [uncultured Paludibaculum sp.]
MTIRPMTMADLAVIERIQEANPTGAQWNPIDYLAYTTTMAEIGGAVVGFLCVHPLPNGVDGRTEAEILNLAIDPAHKRKGVATALLAKIDFQVIYLDVRENNRPALEFYRKFGFRKTGHRRKYYHHPVEDSIMMTRG